MRQFVISEAQASRVARHVREAVEDEGGIVAKHTAHETEFDHLDYGDQAWRRAGYVGTYERFKEKPVQVRIRVWAQWPRRLLISSVYLGFTVAVLFFLASLIGLAIPPNAWILTSLPILAAIAITFLLYTSSIPDSEAAEEHIETKLAERVAEDDQIPGAVYDLDAWEDHRERLIEEAREEAKERVPHGGSKVKRALASATSTLGGSEETDAEDEDGFLDRVRQDDEDDTEGEESSLADRVPGLGSGDEETDEEPADRQIGSETDDSSTPPSADDETDEPDTEELEAEEDEGSSWTDKLPFGSSDEEDEEPEEEELESEEDEGSSLTDKLPFGSSEDDTDEDAEDGDAEGLGSKLASALPGGGDEDAEDGSDTGDDTSRE